MTSKKNRNLTRNLADEKQRFGIRKFSVGVASVLLGTSLMFGANTQIVHADSENGGINSSTETTSEVQSKSENDAANTANVQNEAKATENKVETSNTENQSAKEVKVDQSVGSTATDNKEEQKTSLENKSEANKTSESKVEKANPVEVKSESHEDLTSDKKGTETQTLKLASATPLSAKALTESKAQNQDTVTANVNLSDDDPNFGTGDTITTKTYTLNSGATVTDLINQIKKDLNTVTEDYYGPDPKLDTTVNDTPAATGTYKHAPLATLDDKTRRFNLDPSTLKDKPTLAGYTITTDNNDNLDAAITNNATYNINLIHRMSVLQDENFYKSYTRQITYKMYGLDNQSIAPTTVTQYAVARAQDGKNYNRISSVTNHNEVNIADVGYSWDMATGAQNNLTTFSTNWRGLVLVFDGQKSPVATDGSEYSQLAGWIPDKDVDPTGNTQRTGYSLWQNAPGLFYKNKHVDAVQDETVTYYHNQPVDLSFEDISTVAPQDLSGNNYEASNELTYDNTASSQYDVYGALNKDGKNLSDVIKSIEDKGYKLVSITNDDDASQTDLKDNSQINLTYDKDGVWKNDQLVHKAYTIKFVHDVKPTTENTSVSRNIHYVADEGNSKYEVLKDPDTQTVNFERTAYIDQVTKQEVVKNADGTYSELPADFNPTWKAVGTDNFDKIQKDRFNKDEGKVPGVWEIERANYDDPEGTQLTDNFAPEVANVDAAKTYKDIYLVYREKAQYNIHYIDVNGVEGKTTYEPTDGHELTDHLVPNVGEGKGIFVGDTPDATQKLWSPADYEKAGYVLVGLSDNAKGDLLGKQTLTHGVQDQYVYLKHAVKTITPNTPASEVPKDPNGNPIVDPSDLHKEFHRTIFYKANATDGQTLMGQTDQKTEFNGTIAYDVVTGKTTTPETVKDVNGKDVQVATLKDGTITWDKQNDKFSAINQPTIELKKGDKYATSDDMIGTWELVDGEAGEVDLTPNSKNPDDKTLVYKQKAQYNIHYIDVNGVENTTAYVPTDGKELTDHLVQNVGEGKDIYVGDTPDATQKLWSPADYEKAGYVLVGLSDNAKGDLLGKQTLTHGVQDQYVYLKHAVKDITPNTPASDVPKDPDGKRAVDPSDLHKEFTRNITFVANNDVKSPLKDAVSQKVEFDGHIYVDMVTGQTTTPETVNDANGKTTQVATTKAGNIEWNHDTQTMDEVVQKYITLNKGDKYATSDDMVGTRHWISGTADEITLKPTSNNPADLVLVYEKNQSETGPDEDHDLPKVDVKQETKTFTRTVVYRGTKDGGVHFESVNGSPDGKNTYKQTVTFTRNIFSTTDKDGKVTILKTTPWTAKDDTLGEVVSKTPNEVGYEVVDIEKVDAHKIDPDKDPENLGETIVTYSMKPKHETGPDEDHDLPKVDVKQETKTFIRTVVYRGTKDDGKTYEDVNGSPDGKNTYKQTVTFTRNVFSTTDKEGKVTILETTPWTAKDDTLGEVVSKTPNEVGYEVVDIEKVDAHKIDPDKDPENLGETIVTYSMKPKHETGPSTDYDLPNVDIKEETKTFTRTVVYRGTKDGGKTYEDVNGSPNGKNTYKQTVTFTRNIFSTTDKDGKVTILETTPWKTQESMGQVDSKKPSEVDYDMVDIESVPSITVDPNSDKTDLGTTVVTYRSNPIETTSVSRNIYYYDAETGKTINEQLGFDAAPAIKQTVDYVEVPVYNKFGIFLGFAQLSTNPNGTAKLIDGKPVIEKDNNGNPILQKDANGNIITNKDKAWVATGTHTEYPKQESYDLTKYGYKKAQSFNSKRNDGDAALVSNKESDPTKNGQDVNVYYYHDQKDIPYNDPEFPIDAKDVKKTFIRTIVYRGTRDGGKTYQAVNGSPDSKNIYKQSVTFTRNVVIDAVTKSVLGYGKWTSNNSTMEEVDSKAPQEVDYSYVDIPKVDQLTINPDSTKTDLGTITVTYTPEDQPPVENTYHVTVHYVDEDSNVIKDPVQDPADFKNGESYDENSRKDSTIEHDGKTYEFTRVKEGDIPAGSINGKDVDVTYVYKLKKNPVTPVVPPVEETYHVTVHYVDEDGNVIKDPVKDPADFKNGESYDENSRKDSTIEHDGKTYEFTRVKEGDFPAGSINGKDVDVTYVYKLKKTPVTPVVPPFEETYTVTVNFVDEHGNVLQDSRKSSDHKDDTDYNESNHPTTITKDGKTYTYTRVEGDTPTGTINGKDVVITYVYKEVVTPVTPPVEETHTVTVHYVDEDGNVIKDPVKDMTEFKNGESYDENSKKDTTIEHDGKTYEFTHVKEGDSSVGTIDGKDVDVTYVYKLKETPERPETPVTPVKPSDKTTSPAKDNNVQHSNTEVPTQKSSTTPTMKTLSSTTSVVTHNSSTPSSPARQNNAKPTPSTKSNNKLPQTGKKDSSLFSVLGLTALGVASVLTLLIDHKKRN